MSEHRSDGGSAPRSNVSRVLGAFDPEELRRRNRNAVTIDVLFLFTTAFLAILLTRGFWPAAITAVPLATLLYFAWRSTPAFFVAEVLVIVLTVAASYAGVLPL